jgi:hypothetical protein
MQPMVGRMRPLYRKPKCMVDARHIPTRCARNTYTGPHLVPSRYLNSCHAQFVIVSRRPSDAFDGCAGHRVAIENGVPAPIT